MSCASWEPTSAVANRNAAGPPGVVHVPILANRFGGGSHVHPDITTPPTPPLRDLGMNVTRIARTAPR